MYANYKAPSIVSLRSQEGLGLSANVRLDRSRVLLRPQNTKYNLPILNIRYKENAEYKTKHNVLGSECKIFQTTRYKAENVENKINIIEFRLQDPKYNSQMCLSPSANVRPDRSGVSAISGRPSRRKDHLGANSQSTES